MGFRARSPLRGLTIPNLPSFIARLRRQAAFSYRLLARPGPGEVAQEGERLAGGPDEAQQRPAVAPAAFRRAGIGGNALPLEVAMDAKEVVRIADRNHAVPAAGAADAGGVAGVLLCVLGAVLDDQVGGAHTG